MSEKDQIIMNQFKTIESLEKTLKRDSERFNEIDKEFKDLESKNYELKDKLANAQELLLEWYNTPFFEKEEDWEKWVVPLRPKLERWLVENGALPEKSTSSKNIEAEKA